MLRMLLYDIPAFMLYFTFWLIFDLRLVAKCPLMTFMHSEYSSCTVSTFVWGDSSREAAASPHCYNLAHILIPMLVEAMYENIQM